MQGCKKPALTVPTPHPAPVGGSFLRRPASGRHTLSTKVDPCVIHQLLSQWSPYIRRLPLCPTLTCFPGVQANCSPSLLAQPWQSQFSTTSPIADTTPSAGVGCWYPHTATSGRGSGFNQSFPADEDVNSATEVSRKLPPKRLSRNTTPKWVSPHLRTENC